MSDTVTAGPLRAEVSELVKRAEAIEAKYKEDELWAADDMALYTQMSAQASFKTLQARSIDEEQGNIQVSDRWLRGLGINVDGLTEPKEGELAKMASQTGIIAPRPGMTLGDRFTKSEAFGDYTKRHLKTENGAPTLGSKGVQMGKSAALELDASLISMNRQNRNQLVHTGDSDFGENGGRFIMPSILPMIDEAPFATDAFLWDLCTRIEVSGGGYKYPVLTSRVNNADWVAESVSTADFAATDQTLANGYKPESDMTFDQRSGTTETLAHFIPLTRQIAAHAPSLVTFVETFLRIGLRVKAHDSMLNGSGNSPEIRGMLNTTNPYNNIFSVSVGGGDRFNAILAAMSVVGSAREGAFSPNAILINRADYFSTEFLGAQDTNGNWKFGGPAAPPASLNPWGLRAIVTEAIPAGTQLIGDFRWALIADAMSTQMYMTDSHKDWFERNILALLVEMEMGFELMAEEAFAQIVA